jgi:hypothetical protein
MHISIVAILYNKLHKTDWQTKKNIEIMLKIIHNSIIGEQTHSLDYTVFMTPFEKGSSCHTRYI